MLTRVGGKFRPSFSPSNLMARHPPTSRVGIEGWWERTSVPERYALCTCDPGRIGLDSVSPRLRTSPPSLVEVLGLYDRPRHAHVTPQTSCRVLRCPVFTRQERQKVVPETGLEPALITQPDPKSGASTNSATPAFGWAEAQCLLLRLHLQMKRRVSAEFLGHGARVFAVMPARGGSACGAESATLGRAVRPGSTGGAGRSLAR